jgi:hypothetical protein
MNSALAAEEDGFFPNLGGPATGLFLGYPRKPARPESAVTGRDAR